MPRDANEHFHAILFCDQANPSIAYAKAVYDYHDANIICCCEMIGLHAAHLLLIISHQLLPGAKYFVILDALAAAAVFAHCAYTLNDDHDFYTCPLLLSRSTLLRNVSMDSKKQQT
jgi:hypothetical protein